MKVMLANIDYEQHMTDEGNQLQRGLESAGWHLSGNGFDGITDVSKIMEKYRPTCVIVHDKRDWDPKNPWAFRDDLGFDNLESVKQSAQRIGVVKDAGSMQEYHRYYCEEEISCTGIITYYHDNAVLPLNPWMTKYPRIRTYHSVDSEYIRSVNFTTDRSGVIVTGAKNRDVYPLRAACFDQAQYLKAVALGHPGYDNLGVRTNGYLKTLSFFKVHIATASKYHFALRKIIESVAMGCVPITNLPYWDRLPEIDDALVRVTDDISLQDLKSLINFHIDHWDPIYRWQMAEKCLNYYDFRYLGRKLDESITFTIGQGKCKS